MNPDPIQSEDPKPVVLVVDDSLDVQRLLRARLRSEDLDLICADNGADGVALARARLPAIILLDLDMPDVDGFEVLRALKDDQRTLEIPVIVLSGLQNAQDKVTAFDLGAVDYITKPFDLMELRCRVRAALRLHHLVQMLAQRAQIDGLTGLWNRAYFDSRWKEEFSRAVRYDRPVSLSLLDIDHFKSVNDTYGHPAGDAVLQAFCKVLLRESRHTDIACRYGGEEFALIMPDTAPADAAGVCDRIRAAVAALVWSRHPDRAVTVSAGVAGGVPVDGFTPVQWIEAADEQLYSAKHGGRNRVMVRDTGANPLTLARAG
ncbi:MAG: diguanylate cyclase [Phycisphaerales bacterium]|nr:diguanylate cyclase [Phycisphaerales bacterium]